MLKFDEKAKKESINGALALRPGIEKIVDEFYDDGFDAVFFMGIGGTWASGMQAEVYTRGKSKLPIYVENASEYLTTGNKRLTEKSIVIFSSVTGTTKEMVEALEIVKKTGARIFGFVNVKGSLLDKLSDWCISYPDNEQLKFFMVANRLMHRAGDFPDYDAYNKEMENHLADGLIEVEKKADDYARAFAEEKYKYRKERPDMPHYFVGSGNQWGATYSYAMCYWEEQMWIRTRSVTASEFFHGMLEIIDAETPVTLFLTEDEQRKLGERVANFLSMVCRNYNVIDSKDYAMKGISEKYRGSISHLIIRAVCNRIDICMEREFRHPLEIRRYYRQFPY